MSPRTSRWVERGLLSPACGPRLGQSLSGGGGGIYDTSVPARPCRSTGRAKRWRLPGHTWGAGGGGGGGSLCRFIPLTRRQGLAGG